MAYSVKITGYSKTDGEMLMQMEPQWWNAHDLIKDERFVESRARKIYYDYDAELSLDEVRELHERYKGNVTTIQKFLCFKIKKLSLPCQQLNDALFKRADKYSHFRVKIVEWEGGL